MKKILTICLAALATSFAANAGSNTSINTMVVAVPEILQITTAPNWQGMTLSETDLAGSANLQDVVYNIKSNATYNVKTEYAASFNFANNPSVQDKDASKAAFRAAMKFARSTNNQWYDLALLEANSPFSETGAPHTDENGVGYTYHSRIDNLGYNAIPGTYTVTLTVTATQP